MDPDHDLAVLADYAGNVVSVDVGKRRLVAKMPHYAGSPITCMTVDGSRDAVLMVHADQRVVECQLGVGKYTRFSTNLRLPKNYINKRSAARGVFWLDKQKIVVFDGSVINVIEKKSDAGKSPSSRRRRKSASGDFDEKDDDDDEVTTVRFVKKYEYLAHLCPLSDGSLVAVEIRPRTFTEQLPPSLKQKKYGTM